MMKKLLALIFITSLTTVFTSCNKDYTCTCTYKTGTYTQRTTTQILQTTKKKAQDECGSQNQKIYNPGTNYYTIVSCGI